MQHIHEKGCNINRRKKKRNSFGIYISSDFVIPEDKRLYRLNCGEKDKHDGISWNVRNNINKSNNFRKNIYFEMISLNHDCTLNIIYILSSI